MHWWKALQEYPCKADIPFTAIPASVARKLWLHAHSNKSRTPVKVNGRSYVLMHVSINTQYRCCSVYFQSGKRLYRISDHWNSGRGNGTTHCPYIKGHLWTLRGPDGSFRSEVRVTGHDYCHGWVTCTAPDKAVEGGWCEARNIKFCESHLLKRAPRD